MSVYVDRLMPCLPNKQWRYRHVSHLTADSVQELVEFALRIGLKREWVQRSRAGIMHFDLIGRTRAKAVEAGAVEK